jgi:Ca2+-binding EF-hand superfamily protein
MAPHVSGNPLKPNEEEWREVWKRLCERFPTVPGHRVAQALREHNGHAGEAAAVLRDLTGSAVKEADPDDVEHVATLLSSPAMFKHACKEQFKKFDVNKDGVLEWDEVKQLVHNLYDEFGLPAPAEGALKAFFYATDENQDGVLSEREFRKFFEMFLRYAFFDHLKLRQMVEKGQEIEQKRASLGGGLIGEGRPEVSGSAETTSPQDSRASSASEASKPDKASREEPVKPSRSPSRAEVEAISRKESNSKLVPDPKQKSAGRSRKDEQDRDHERSRHRDREHRRERQDRERVVELAEGVAYRCVATNGVAFRASPAFQDRVDNTCSKNQSVQVLEHWIRTPDGWLPVMDPQGNTLFERSGPVGYSQPIAAPPALAQQLPPVYSEENPKKRVSIQDKTDTLDVSVRSAARAKSPVPEADGSGLRSNEEEWRPVFDRLSERFPNIGPDKIAQALRDNDGHAGKAASMLRYM